MKHIFLLVILLTIIFLLPAQNRNEMSPKLESVSIFIGRDVSFVSEDEINKSIQVFLKFKNPNSVSHVVINLKNRNGSPNEILSTSDVRFKLKDGKVHFSYIDPFTKQELSLALKRESAMLHVGIGSLMHDAINVEVVLFNHAGDEVDRKLSEIY